MATRLPRQVQEQLDAANALLEQQMNPTPPAPPAPPVEVPPAPPAPPTVEPPQPQPPAPAPATPPQENFEHKYKVLQGMFNQRDRQLQEMQRELQELKARANQPPPAPAPTAPPQPTIDPKDVQAFGEDTMEMVHRVMGDYLARVGQGFETRLKQIEDALAQMSTTVKGTTETVAKTAEDLFFEKLTEKAPEWAVLNEDPAFLAWLAEIDPLYGMPRDAALKDAYGKGDATRAANVFKTYLSTLPPPPAPPAAPPVSPTPRAAGTPPPSGTPAKPMVRQSEVIQFYDQVRRGQYRGRDQERLQLEAQYNAAMAEGRIV